MEREKKRFFILFEFKNSCFLNLMFVSDFRKLSGKSFDDLFEILTIFINHINFRKLCLQQMKINFALHSYSVYMEYLAEI